LTQVFIYCWYYTTIYHVLS